MNRRKFLAILGLGAATTPLTALRPAASAPTPAVDVSFHGPVLHDRDLLRRLHGGIVNAQGRMVWVHAGETILPPPTVQSLKRGNPRKPRAS